MAWEQEIENKMITGNILSNFPILHQLDCRLKEAWLARNVSTFHKDQSLAAELRA